MILGRSINNHLLLTTKHLRTLYYRYIKMNYDIETIYSSIGSQLISPLIQLTPNLTIPDLSILRFIILSAIFSFSANFTDLYNLDIQYWWKPSIANIIFTVFSYLGSRLLTPTWSLSLTSLLPFTHIIYGWIFESSPIRPIDIIWFFPILYAFYTLHKTANKPKSKEQNIHYFDWYVGIISIIISLFAFTFQNKLLHQFPIFDKSTQGFVTNAGAAIIYLLYYIFTQNPITTDKRPRHWLFGLSWNSIIMWFISVQFTSDSFHSIWNLLGILSAYVISLVCGLDIFEKEDIIAFISLSSGLFGLSMMPEFSSTPTTIPQPLAQ